MWLATAFGFYSVVEYDANFDHTDRQTDAAPGSQLLVRARVWEDLEKLRKWLPELVIDDNPHADYRFRAVLSREDWAKILTDTVMDIDYGSHFKEASQQQSTGSKERYSAYMGAWTALSRMQETEPYTGRAWHEPKPVKKSWQEELDEEYDFESKDKSGR